MKTISINRHSLQRGASIERANVTNCSEAFATRSDTHGYRVVGFDRDGRRWSISIDERLIDDLAAIRARKSD
jgi:hypothetical protein